MAASCGVNTTPLLKQAGISPQQLSDINARIPGDAMEGLLELLIDASKDPCFGLHSAEFVEPASYGVLGYITMNCATLREVLAKIPIYEPIVGDMGISTAEFDRDHVTQHWHCQFTRPLSRRHEIENVLACWQRYAQNFLHFPELVDAVYLEHSAPDDVALLEEYRAVFGVIPQFDHPFSGLRIPKHLLDKPIPQADNQLLQTLLDHATKTLTSIHHNQPLFAQVKNLLRLSLKDHAPSSTLIAKHLNISSRTLQRKLNDEGYQYKGLLNEVRLELALHYLQSTQLSLDNIAYELGYTETRSFHRGFKQWTGRTAGSFRN
ncbi:probable transcriptional regulator [marine gamma proteobacterium HTCC2143]|jgi:AraC-like DNA-binding protein|uniref:Probable transcriptional regulator n=1 Tax=marine gamma proteobacterium HTCC2143 TaxID=247633 RepID=A0YFG7_9GAMM|nr:probable transcriptional regulator [marine gamma proteobacterium HTCC2143]